METHQLLYQKEEVV